MKKIFLLLVLVTTCLIITSCKKEETPKTVGGYENNFLTEINMDEESLKIFNSARENYTSLELEPIALLATQVVAGENLMYLAKGYQGGEEDKAIYKIVIIYKDLEGKSTITKVKDFNYTKYVNENKSDESSTVSGGWVIKSNTNNKIPEEVATIFNNATSTITGAVYTPIALLGSQIVSGTNYAILCYGSPSYDFGSESIYLLTLYKDLHGTEEVISQSYVDLTEYN